MDGNGPPTSELGIRQEDISSSSSNPPKEKLGRLIVNKLRQLRNSSPRDTLQTVITLDHQANSITSNRETQEFAISFPELIANEPIENTTLAYSVPVMGEWNNGNLLRMLRGMLGQRTENGETFEINVLANIGRHILKLEDRYSQDAKGRTQLLTTPENEEQRNALRIFQESQEAIAYLKKLVKAQRLSRMLIASPEDDTLKQQLHDLLEGVKDPLQKTVLQLGVDNANSIGVSVIDATRTTFPDKNFEYNTMSYLRTMGADVMRARFEKNPHLALCLFDSDTVLADNNAVRDMQRIYRLHPELNYLFTGLTNLPVGVSQELVTDGPRENVRRTLQYNHFSQHGSPQISFRLRAYDKLNEIAGWGGPSFNGDEDRDTSFRLIYHFGNLQDGLLLERSGELYAPTAMTADRLDGSFDARIRRDGFTITGVEHLEDDLGNVLNFRELINKRIENEQKERQDEIKKVLESAREHYGKKEKVQQRFNRLLLDTFYEALDKQIIHVKDNEVETNSEELLSLTGGEALLHYIRANNDLIRDILGSPDDLEVIKYYLGRSESAPESATPFQQAIREYIGDVLPLQQLIQEEVVTAKDDPDNNSGWKAHDQRPKNSSISLMHSTIAELLALAHVYRTFFETDNFLETQKEFTNAWPTNPDDQKLPLHFGGLAERVEQVKRKMNVKGERIQGMNWMKHVRLGAFPIFELFKCLQNE